MDFQTISLDDILIRHWILFEYDVKDLYHKESVHYLFKVKDSIHYKALVSEDYSDYVKLIKTTKQQEHSLHSFLSLKENFNVDFLYKESNKIILEWVDDYNKYVVIDGCHRLSIVAFKEIFPLNIKWFSIKNYKNGKRN